MAHVYISHSSPDKKITQSLFNGLKKLGHTVTMDVDTLVGGQEWRKTLMQALESCNAVVALITDNDYSRQFVLAEIGAARALKKILIPVVVGAMPRLPVIQDIHYITADTKKLSQTVKEINRAICDLENRDVFIVHGQNEAKKLELKSFLSEIGLRPVILHEQDDKGKTIIEKFEYYASRAAFAFILMTPDDKTAVWDSTEAKWRARQNVIMELGWFMAKLGREHVVILYKGELEIPSDILGVVYLQFNDSVLEVSERIRQRLKGSGLIK